MKRVFCLLLAGCLAMPLFAWTGCAADVNLETGSIHGICTHIDERFGSAQTDIGLGDLLALDLEPGDLLTIGFDSVSFRVPYVHVPGDVPHGSFLAFEYGGNLYVGLQYGNFAGEHDITAGMSVKIELFQKQGYATELAVQHLVRPTDRASYESDEAFGNFREIGIGAIAPGVLYRASHPASTDTRSPFVECLMEAAGVQTIVNVGETEAGLPSAYALSPVYRAHGEAGRVMAVNLGLLIESETFRDGVRQAIEFIAMGEPPYLIHCWEGKDRSGVLAAILAALMGASLDEIIADYMTTYANYYGIVPGHQLYDDTANLILAKLVEMNDGAKVNSHNVNSAVEHYVLGNLGISEEQLALLRTVLSGS
jgi:protein tyrosine/serine phosphatase